MRGSRATMLTLTLAVLGTGASTAMMGRMILAPDPMFDTSPQSPPPVRALCPSHHKHTHMQQVGTLHHNTSTIPLRPSRLRPMAVCTRR